MIPMLDMGWFPIMMMAGIYTIMIMAPFTILIEGLIIWRFLKLPFWRAMKDAVAINIASALFGYAYLVVMGSNIGNIASNYSPHPGDNYYESTPEAVIVALLLMLGIPYLVSIVVEWLVLIAMEEDSQWSLSFLGVLLGNTASYLGLLVVGFRYLWQ